MPNRRPGSHSDVLQIQPLSKGLGLGQVRPVQGQLRQAVPKVSSTPGTSRDRGLVGQPRRQPPSRVVRFRRPVIGDTQRGLLESLAAVSVDLCLFSFAVASVVVFVLYWSANSPFTGLFTGLTSLQTGLGAIALISIFGFQRVLFRKLTRHTPGSLLIQKFLAMKSDARRKPNSRS